MSTNCRDCSSERLSGPAVTILGPADFRSLPWRNGRGQSLELHREPDADDFLWRLTRSAIVEDGPFSDFSGYDRHLLVLSGAGVVLEHSSGQIDTLIRPLDMARFSGDWSTQARLVSGPVEDFNLMVRRDYARAEVEVIGGSGKQVQSAGRIVLVYAVGAPCRIQAQNGAVWRLSPGQLLLDKSCRPKAWELTAQAAVLILIKPHQSS